MPASGSMWVEPGVGRVLKTTVKTGDDRFSMSATVTYHIDERLGQLVPARMTESYQQGTEHLNGTATYRNFRRFTVKTQEEIKREGR